MAQVWDFHTSGETVSNVILQFGERSNRRSLDFAIYADAKNTIEYLQWLAWQYE